MIIMLYASLRCCWVVESIYLPDHMKIVVSWLCPTEFTPIVSFHMRHLFQSGGSPMLPCSHLRPVTASTGSPSALGFPASGELLKVASHSCFRTSLPGKALLFLPFFPSTACSYKYLSRMHPLDSAELFYELKVTLLSISEVVEHRASYWFEYGKEWGGN